MTVFLIIRILFTRNNLGKLYGFNRKKILTKLNKVFDLITTLFNKVRFKKFGRNSIIRYGCIINNPKLIEIEENVHIGSHVWLNAQDESKNESTKLIIKKGSHISRFCHINAFKKVIIEEDVLISENVYLGDADHKTSLKDIPIIKQGNEIKGEVIIKKGSFICKKCNNQCWNNSRGKLCNCI